VSEIVPPTCILKTPGLLARHIKSNHAAIGEAANSDLPPAQQDEAAEPELPRGPVLVVGPGHRPRNYHPVPLTGDNEFGLIACQSHRQRPGMQEDA
jgi:hypothetical protein